MSLFDNRGKMWFGTEERMGWIETPQTGADVSPVRHGAQATLLNGRGFSRDSWASHKEYQFSWGDSADLRLASKISAYASGSYGRGLIYFHDPMYYGTNLLARHHADPSMALNYEAPSLIDGIDPRSTPTGNNTNDLPLNRAIYDVPAGYSAQSAGDEIFIPIPDGHTAFLGAIYTSTTGADLYFRTPGGTFALTKVGPNASNIAPDAITGQPWVRIGMRNTSGASVAISIAAMTLRISDTVAPVANFTDGPWLTGEGSTGCRFVGMPTRINYNGVMGGQVGVSATLKEVDAWG